MQSCDRVVMISTLGAELINKPETIQQFREDGITRHVLDEMSGLLLYGDQYIFYCFESKYTQINQLKHNLLVNPYFINQKLIYDKTHVEPKFNSWSMVYVLTETRIQNFIQKHNWNDFNPHLLEGELLDEFMEVIYSYSDIHESTFIDPDNKLVGSLSSPTKSLNNKQKFCVIAAIGFVLILGFMIYGLGHFD